MTREEAIKICKQVRKYFNGGKLATDDTDAIYEALTEAIEALKAETWIPCSERMPEDGQEILATITDASYKNPVIIRHYDPESEEKILLAWMPLPEPYE